MILYMTAAQVVFLAAAFLAGLGLGVGLVVALVIRGYVNFNGRDR